MSFLLSYTLIHLIASIYYTIFIDAYKLFPPRTLLSFFYSSQTFVTQAPEDECK